MGALIRALVNYPMPCLIINRKHFLMVFGWRVIFFTLLFITLTSN
jgi:hypothetical protein